MSAGDPLVLIVRNHGRPRAAENEANAKRADDFSVGKMGDNLANAPFVRSRPPAQSGYRHALEQTFEFPCGCSLHGEGLLAFHIAKHALRVLLWCFAHFHLQLGVTRRWSSPLAGGHG